MSNNLLWFMALVLISLWIMYITYKKTKFRHNLALYFFTMGLAFIMEYIVLILGGAYTYYPRFFSNQWYDDVFGSSISQAFFIPSVLVAIAAFRIPVKWVVLIIVAILGLEEFFLWLGIYEHNWWKSWFTSIILFVSVFVVKWWRNRIEGRGFFFQFVTIYMTITTIFQGLTFYLTAILKTHHYTLGLFESPYQDHIAFSVFIWLIYAVLLTVIIMRFYRFVWLALLFFADFSFHTILIKMEILHVSSCWHPIYFSLMLIILLMIIKKMNSKMFA
ncbi:hypothetical protein [Cytobacillus sp. NCCP-133]|uniref:hypothetical protein n=1 Tax=Cytobacillus sp. NCCP-133 TaxID=766848 RepID=UPI002230443E|nr:hypothetical protein [Cytobacillus sp. NCCP-133]